MIDFTVPAELQELLDRVKAYISEDVLPGRGQRSPTPTTCSRRGTSSSGCATGRASAGSTPRTCPRSTAAWASAPLGMALVSQELGTAPLGALGMNCMAPDEGNMHTLLIAGSEEQKERWLRPLAEGSIRSCFAMTEPEVASSDPTNLETTAVLCDDGDEWVLNGRKWCITGADRRGVLDRGGQDGLTTRRPATATTR